MLCLLGERIAITEAGLGLKTGVVEIDADLTAALLAEWFGLPSDALGYVDAGSADEGWPKGSSTAPRRRAVQHHALRTISFAQSMGPKAEAACRFVELTVNGRRVGCRRP